jgi:hypothetical protein
MIAIKQLFSEKGIEDVRPTDEALKLMRMSRRRFTQLSEGTNKTEINVSEMEALKKWVKGVKEINPDELLPSEIHQ